MKTYFKMGLVIVGNKKYKLNLIADLSLLTSLSFILRL